MALINELKVMTLTTAINMMKSPNQFLKRRLFGNHVTHPTEDFETHIINNGRNIAPFIRKNGEATMVGGYTTTRQVVSPTNIRIKRPFTASDLLFGRYPGSVIYIPNGNYQMNQIQQHIARDMQVMADLITNAEEYLCAMALQGTISYSSTDQEVFTITFPKPTAHNITLTTFWDTAGVTAGDFSGNLIAVKRLISEAVGLSVTDCILGTDASDALRALVNAGTLKNLNQLQVNGGQFDFVQQFNEDGVLYLGQLEGISFWEYGRTASLNGTTVDMIRPKYAEFIAASPSAEFVMNYGAISDMKALQGRSVQAERFSKAWEEEDPSVLMNLVATRPLPTPQKPGAIVSMKVSAG